MGYGCNTTDAQSETVEATVQDAQQLDENGVIQDYTTHGGEKTETITKVIVGAEPDVTSLVTNSQTGTSITTSASIDRGNQKYAEITETTKTALA